MGLKIKCCLALVAILFGWPALANDGVAVRRTEDVIYGRKHGMALTLDVFQPVRRAPGAARVGGAPGAASVGGNGCGLLFLINGGWQSSKATQMMVTIRPQDYQPFLERGYTVFAVVTSSQPKFAIPEIVADVQRAVRFVRSNAAAYGVRPNRLGILGSSSGGHLVLSIAAQGAAGRPDAEDPVERESSAVQAATCFFPPTDFLNYGGPGICGVGAGPLAPLRAAFGPRALDPKERLILGREISPIYFVTAKVPPTLIIHGDADAVVPLQQSTTFVQRAKAAGAKNVELLIRPGKGHGWGDFWRSSEDITAFADWFDRYLRDRRQ
jgi:acetyl esterase/lipase